MFVASAQRGRGAGHALLEETILRAQSIEGLRPCFPGAGRREPPPGGLPGIRPRTGSSCKWTADFWTKIAWRWTSAHANEVKIALMLNFRQFEVGPDPFGAKWQVLFKWLQTAISLRHSDTVDVQFLLESGDSHAKKQIAMPHAELLELGRRTNHELNDAWCARLAAMHLKYMVETGEDLDKDLVTVSAAELGRYAATIAQEESAEVAVRRAAN